MNPFSRISMYFHMFHAQFYTLYIYMFVRKIFQAPAPLRESVLRDKKEQEAVGVARLGGLPPNCDSFWSAWTAY